MKSRFICKSVLTLVCLVFTAIPAVSNAALLGPDKSNNAVRVTFSDLDLSSMEGVRTLYQRLRNSAYQVCGRQNGRELMELTIERKQCFDTALSKAVKSINNSRLERLHLNSN